MVSVGIVDVYRMHHPESREFTLHWTGERAHSSCIDRICVTDTILPYVVTSSFVFINESDHPKSPVNNLNSTTHIERGKGYWRMNPILLHEKNVLEVFERLVQEFTNLIILVNNPIHFWCLLKISIVNYLKVQVNLRVANLKREKRRQRHHLQYLQRQFRRHPHSEEAAMEMALATRVHSQYVGIQRARSSRVGRARWFEEVEKCSKFFYSRIKYRSTSLIAGLKRPENTVTRDRNEMCSIVDSFYQSLYSPEKVDEEVQLVFLNSVTSCLSSEEANALDESFTIEEIVSIITETSGGTCQDTTV